MFHMSDIFIKKNKVIKPGNLFLLGTRGKTVLFCLKDIFFFL